MISENGDGGDGAGWYRCTLTGKSPTKRKKGSLKHPEPKVLVKENALSPALEAATGWVDQMVNNIIRQM